MRNAHGKSSIHSNPFKIIIFFSRFPETTTQELQEFVSSNFNMACDICETIFDSLTHAKSHYLNDHDEPKGYLKCCDIKLRSLREVEEHVDWHKNPGQHK